MDKKRKTFRHIQGSEKDITLDTDLEKHTIGHKILRQVKDLEKHITLQTPYLEQKVELSWTDGMVGVLPVFDNYEKALIYAGGNTNRLVEMFIPKDKYEEYRNI